jgi:predicted GIY-YIG superfamily endonuclease
MRRRTFRNLKARVAAKPGAFHHHVYVVLLAPEAAKDRKVRAQNKSADRAKPCVYVGMTGLQPEERFWNHKNGEHAARLVKRFGVQLLPELFAHLNPMPFEAAAQMEKELAEDLRAQGYTVAGGT